MKKLLLGVLAPAAIAMGLSGPAAAKDLLFLSEDVPPSLNYDGPNASAPPTQMGIVNLMDPLVYYAEKERRADGSVVLDVGKFEGRLAESWSYDASTLTWTFNLRRGVKGCNGTTFDADDVIYTMQRAKSTSGQAPVGWFLSNVASIKGFTPAVFGDKPENLEAKKLKDDEVKKIDQYTVQFTQSAANKLFLPVLTIFALYIFDKETMEEHATADDPWSHKYANNEGVPGFGPYCLDRWEKDKEFVVLANPGYYRGKADIDRVIMRKIPQSGQRLVILRSGQAHLVEHLTPKEYDSLKTARGVRVVSVEGNASTYVHMNWQQKPFDNIKLREAVAYAIPYDKIMKDVFFGEATKYNGVMPSFYPGAHDTGINRVQDLEKAKALLAEAGFPGGKGLEAFPEAFLLTYTTEVENILGPAATILQTELKKIGIPVVLNPIPQTQFSDRELVKKDLPFALINHSKPIGVEAGYAIQLLYVSRDKGGLSNYSLYSNPTVDQMWLEQAKNEPDDGKRNNLMAQIQDILMKEVVIAPLVENRLQWAMSDKVSGVGFHPEQALRWHDLRMAE
ncbi:MAG: ABC transporter substrate-binding protein [Proteobacteria bacterium]|nr:ABC transporter substrate-binding protein [Pseudomonadota bacterium]MDA1060090.1 ABC transporter substrate-binding protein [Pseudomonadota bacterium]